MVALAFRAVAKLPTAVARVALSLLVRPARFEAVRSTVMAVPEDPPTVGTKLRLPPIFPPSVMVAVKELVPPPDHERALPVPYVAASVGAVPGVTPPATMDAPATAAAVAAAEEAVVDEVHGVPVLPHVSALVVWSLLNTEIPLYSVVLPIVPICVRISWYSWLAAPSCEPDNVPPPASVASVTALVSRLVTCDNAPSAVCSKPTPFCAFCAD